MKFFQRKRREKLYRQWVERAGLPPEAVRPETENSDSVHPQVDNAEAIRRRTDDRVVTHPEVTGDMMAEIDKYQAHRGLLYILLVVSFLILCVGLVLVIVYSC